MSSVTTQDPNTKIHIKIDDGGVFKALINFLNDMISNDIYMVFDKDYLKINFRTQDPDNGFFIDAFIVIQRWNLTEYQYVANKKSYILGLEIGALVGLVKSCGKNDYFILQREGSSAGGVRTTKSPKEFKYSQEVSIMRYNLMKEIVYKMPKSEPVCIVNGAEFCDMCSNFKDKNSKDADTIEMTIFKTGMIFSSSIRDKDDHIVQGQIKYLGFIPEDVQGKKISCHTSKANLTKLTNLKKVCPKGNIKIYVEKDNKNKLKPMKLIYNIGSFGKITIYIKIRENKQ